VKDRVHLTELTYDSVDEGVLSGKIDLSEFYLVMNRNK
jgi:hypothetical protein